MNRSTYIRVSLLTLMAMGIAAIPVFWGSNQGVLTMYNAPLRWIPRDSVTRAGFNRFLAQFESHEMLLVSWPGCTVDDLRLKEVGAALKAVRDRRAASGEPELISEVLSGYTMLRMLRREPARLSRNVALDRMRGSLVGADGQTSCVVVTLTEHGALRRRESFNLTLETIQRVTGLQRHDLRVAGPTVDGMATDDESIRSLEKYSVPAILISLALCSVCLRSIWLTLPVLAVGALGQAAMLAIVYFLGITMNAILIVLPPLVFVLTVSAGVHLVNYFYDELRTGAREGATTRALRKGWIPCVLAAVTTAIGLASLMVSEVQPIQQFGALAAIGVLLTMRLLFLLLPGAMEVRLRGIVYTHESILAQREIFRTSRPGRTAGAIRGQSPAGILASHGCHHLEVRRMDYSGSALMLLAFPGRAWSGCNPPSIRYRCSRRRTRPFGTTAGSSSISVLWCRSRS